MKAKLLVATSSFPKKDFRPLARHAELFWLEEMNEGELQEVLPSIDCVFVHLWPKALDAERLSRMTRLSFVQSGLAGVNHIPFGNLERRVVVSSNAGGYSDEVAEYAWGLLVSAAKRIVKLDAELRSKAFKRPSTLALGKEVIVLKGKTLGIAGYGGIGRSVSRFGKTFGMKVLVFSRKAVQDDEVISFSGITGFRKMLGECDAFVLALPLTKLTRDMIGARELALMKRDAVFVNVARAEIVNELAVFRHLKDNSDFTYATDVWWVKEGKESYSPDLPFFELDNFIGTPHASGPSAVAGKGPLKHALQNLLRFLKGERPENVVDRTEYVS